MKKYRVVHYPQIPCKPFIVEVEDLKQASFTMNLFADYDLFQYENKIKPDYANTTTIEAFDEEEQEWFTVFEENEETEEETEETEFF